MKKRSAILLLLSLILLTFLFSGCSNNSSTNTPGKTSTNDTAPDSESEKTYTIKLSHPSAEDHPMHIACLQMAEEAAEKSNGRLNIEIYAYNALGDATDVIDQIQQGVVDAGLYTTGQLSAYDVNFNVVAFPFLYDGFDHVFQALDGDAGDMIKDLAEKYNFHIMNFWDFGFRQITNSVHPINTPEDMKGLKMRVPSEPVNEATMRALGAVPTTIAFSELYMAMQQGVCDGQENPLTTIFTNKLYEANKYVAMVDYCYNTSALVFNLDMWNELPEDLQKILREVGENAKNYDRQLAIEANDSTVAEMEALGVEFTYPDLSAFREAVQPALDELVASVDKDFANQCMDLVDAAR